MSFIFSSLCVVFLILDQLHGLESIQHLKKVGRVYILALFSILGVKHSVFPPSITIWDTVLFWFVLFSLGVLASRLSFVHNFLRPFIKNKSWIFSCIFLCVGFPGGSAIKNPPAMQKSRVWSLGWKDTLRRKWQPTPVFLPGEAHGQWSLVCYSPWGQKELDTA